MNIGLGPFNKHCYNFPLKTVGKSTTKGSTVKELLKCFWIVGFILTFMLPKMAIAKPSRVGSYKLICVGVAYKGRKKNPSKSSCASTAKKVAKFYERNSRGKLKFKTAGYQYKAPCKGSRSCYKNSVRIIKNKYKADFYIIPGIFTHPHAGGKVAYVKGTQVMTAGHEVGHLLGLGHAGAYKKVKGKWKLEHYRDGHSIMSRFYSNYITAPQYLWMQWTPRDEVAVFKLENGETQDFTLKRVSDFDGDGLAVVKIPHTEWPKRQETLGESAKKKEPRQRDAYLSFILKCKSGCGGLHLAVGGGSQRAMWFGQEHHDARFTGLYFKKLKFEDNQVTYRISTKPIVSPEDEMLEGEETLMPKCSPEIHDGVTGYYNRVRKQVKKFKPIVAGQREALVRLFKAYKQSLIDGTSPERDAVIMESADTLRADVCRVKKEDDQYLVFGKKDGIRAYSGANFMLRELNPSKLVVFGPHDGGDATFSSTKKAFEKTKAMAMFANSHHRRLGPKQKDGNSGDMARERTALGFQTMQYFFQEFRQMLVFHMHGMVKRSLLFRSRKSKPIGKRLNKLFPKAVKAVTTIKKSNSSFNAYYEIDPKVTSQTYVKVEFPVTKYRARPDVLAVIFNKLLSYEGMAWARVWKDQ